MTITFEKIVLIIFAFYGLQMIISQGKPTKPFRDIVIKIIPASEEFITCPLCLGFWTGGLIWFLLLYAPEPYQTLALLMLSSAGTCLFFTGITAPPLILEGDDDDNVSNNAN